MAATESDQTKYLDAAREVVKREAFNMQRCLDKGQLMDGLRHATEMLNELRTSILMPKSYYELYMMVTMELTHLNMYMSGRLDRQKCVPSIICFLFNCSRTIIVFRNHLDSRSHFRIVFTAVNRIICKL